MDWLQVQGSENTGYEYLSVVVPQVYLLKLVPQDRRQALHADPPRFPDTSLSTLTLRNASSSLVRDLRSNELRVEIDQLFMLCINNCVTQVPAIDGAMAGPSLVAS